MSYEQQDCKGRNIRQGYLYVLQKGSQCIEARADFLGCGAWQFKYSNGTTSKTLDALLEEGWTVWSYGAWNQEHAEARLANQLEQLQEVAQFHQAEIDSVYRQACAFLHAGRTAASVDAVHDFIVNGIGNASEIVRCVPAGS